MNTFSNERQNVVPKLRAIEVDGRTFRNEHPLTIRNKCSRCSKQTVFGKHFHFGIEWHRHCVVVLGEKWLHVVRSTGINRNGENPDVLVFEVRVGPLHGGHLCLTDRSPGGPEPHYEDVARKVAGADDLSIQIRQTEVREGFARIRRHKAPGESRGLCLVTRCHDPERTGHQEGSSIHFWSPSTRTFRSVNVPDDYSVPAWRGND